MLDFFKKIFVKENSSETAKERLRLVLLSDHISLAPDVIERLKADLLEVISRYVEIDQSHADVTFEHREREIAMLANVPIVGLRDRGGPPPSSGGSARRYDDAPPPSPAPLRAQPDAVAAAPRVDEREDLAEPVPAFDSNEAGALRDDAAGERDFEPVDQIGAASDAAVADAAVPVPEATNAADAAHVSEAKANNAPKRSANGAPKRRRRRKPSAPKKVPASQPALGSLGNVPRPAQA